jgi:hypothetical protein
MEVTAQILRQAHAARRKACPATALRGSMGTFERARGHDLQCPGDGHVVIRCPVRLGQ